MTKKMFKEWERKKIIAIFESIMAFGKHKGKDISQIDSGYLNWMLQAENPSPSMSKLFPEIKAELAKRRGGSPTTPTTNPTPTPTPTVVNNKNWVLSKVISLPVPNPSGLKIGDAIVIHQVNPTMWIWNGLENNKTGAFPNTVVKNIVLPQEDANNNPIQSTDINELKSKAFDLGLLSSPQPKIKSHIFSDDKLHPEAKSIDEKFAKMINGKQDHMVIEALSGSGKTSTLKHLAWKYGKPGEKWLYLVFNTKNKTEAKEVFPNWVEVETTNGFLGKVLGHPGNISKINQTDRIVSLESPKTGRLEKAKIISDSPEFNKFMTEQGFPDPNDYSQDWQLSSTLRSIRYEYKEEVVKFLGLAKSFAIDPRNKTIDSDIDELAKKYDINNLDDIRSKIAKTEPKYFEKIKKETGFDLENANIEKEVKAGVLWLLNQSLPHNTDIEHEINGQSVSMKHYRDFNDDLWYTAINAENIQWPKYDVVLADEVQDFNETQKIALKKLHDAGAKIVAVGDRKQALYRFRGADSHAFENLSNMLGSLSQDKDVTRTLSKNFRSKKNIIDFVNKNTAVNNLQQGLPTKNGDEGVATKDNMDYEESFSQLKKEKKENGRFKQTAYISRTNEPLVMAALKLMKENIPFVILGKDIAKDLIRHVDKMVSYNKLSDMSDVKNLSNALDKFASEEKKEHHGKSSKSAYLKELDETTGALKSAIAQFEEANNHKSSIGGFKIWLKNRFTGLDTENSKDSEQYKKLVDEINPVVLTTSHRSKGMEFDRVYLLRSDLFPHPRAKRDEDLEQEANNFYVATTRAKDELHILKKEGQPGYEKK